MERANVRRLCLTLLTLKEEERRRPTSGTGGSLAGKGKKTDAPLEPLEGTQPYQHLAFAQDDPLWAWELKNHKIIDLRCFKPLFMVTCYSCSGQRIHFLI